MLDTRINATTQRFAVLGESLKHTWSPFIHNSLFAASGRDAVYLPITIGKDRLGSAVDVLRNCFSGFNVTIPYKERIIPYLDDMDAAARACGAVNTVENRDGRLIGHITDGLGMMSAIEKAGISTCAVRALILGGGGAARVAGYEFLVRGGCVTFAVRNLESGMRLADELVRSIPDAHDRICVCPLNDIPSAYDIIVNCTPIGMFPHQQDAPVSMDVIARCKAVFDAVYNPRQTRLLGMAHALHIPAVEGLGMLFDQAVEAQKIWFGQDIPAPEQQGEIYRSLLELL